MSTRPRLTPAIADVRRAVRTCLADALARHPSPGAPSQNEGDPAVQRPASTDAAETGGNSFVFGKGALVLVALSGGGDSLALAAATAFEAPRAGLRAGAVIVDHALQRGSADVAATARAQAAAIGLDPVLVRRVTVGLDGGPEAAARAARYEALAAAASETGARAVLLGHTLDDQAETVLLGLARGSGPTSLHGMTEFSPIAATDAAPNGPAEYLRPLLGIRRATTVQFCADSGLAPWNDPQNEDTAFARVRVRRQLLPMLEREIGPGVAEALARTAEQLREDSVALDGLADEQIEDLAEHAEAGISLDTAGLAGNPSALRQRIIRLTVAAEFGVSLSRAQTLQVARLVTDWHGQGSVHLPGIRVGRRAGRLIFTAAPNTIPPDDPTRKNSPRT
jgi:tRNA(Ile)-lysidine synthase